MLLAPDAVAMASSAIQEDVVDRARLGCFGRHLDQLEASSTEIGWKLP
jgi:hypothetical protein